MGEGSHQTSRDRRRKPLVNVYAAMVHNPTCHLQSGKLVESPWSHGVIASFFSQHRSCTRTLCGDSARMFALTESSFIKSSSTQVQLCTSNCVQSVLSAASTHALSNIQSLSTMITARNLHSYYHHQVERRGVFTRS